MICQIINEFEKLLETLLSSSLVISARSPVKNFDAVYIKTLTLLKIINTTYTLSKNNVVLISWIVLVSRHLRPL